jgi:hypothetical protein
MANKIELLEALASEAFEVEVGHTLPPAALRARLGSLAEVKEVAIALQARRISEKTIREFLADLMAEFSPQRRFPYDVALAALAVVLERRPTAFADEFLYDLARLSRAEMPVSTRVARECLKQRVNTVTRNQYRQGEYDHLRHPSTAKTYTVFRPLARFSMARAWRVTMSAYSETTPC